MNPDDALRLRACYGQLRLTARSWSAAGITDWPAIDGCLAVVALMAALPECSDEIRDAAAEILQYEPVIR